MHVKIRFCNNQQSDGEDGEEEGDDDLPVWH